MAYVGEKSRNWDFVPKRIKDPELLRSNMQRIDKMRQFWIEEQKRMAKKENTGKPRLELLKRTALEQMAFIRTFGIEKYQNDTDWRLNPVEDYAGAALRHIYKFLDGEEIDQESGYMHLAHAMVDLMLAIELTKD